MYIYTCIYTYILQVCVWVVVGCLFVHTHYTFVCMCLCAGTYMCCACMVNRPGSRRVLDNLVYLVISKEEPNMVVTVFLHSNGSLKGAVSNSKRDTITFSLLDHFAGLILAVASHQFTINL